eukprot:m.34653 g.34653  ORF g.34653 m.34653 type:complete len:341 (-) comp5245_c0_seq1:1356-2378(-)
MAEFFLDDRACALLEHALATLTPAERHVSDLFAARYTAQGSISTSACSTVISRDHLSLHSAPLITTPTTMAELSDGRHCAPPSERNCALPDDYHCALSAGPHGALGGHRRHGGLPGNHQVVLGELPAAVLPACPTARPPAAPVPATVLHACAALDVSHDAKQLAVVYAARLVAPSDDRQLSPAPSPSARSDRSSDSESSATSGTSRSSECKQSGREKSSIRRVFLAAKTSRRTRKEPAREDYASDEQDLFDRDWATWRELRDSNNEAVRRSRASRRARPAPSTISRISIAKSNMDSYDRLCYERDLLRRLIGCPERLSEAERRECSTILGQVCARVEQSS